MQCTPINIFIQRGHVRTTWELDNLGNCLSNSLVTVQGLKLLTNNPWCHSGVAVINCPKSLVLANTCHDIHLFKFLGFNKFLG